MATEDFTSTQIEMLGRRWRENPSPHLSLQLADLYRQRGEIEAALPILETGHKAHPESVSVRVALGRYRMEAGDPGAAAETLRSVVDQDPGHLVANKLLVRAHLELGELQSASDRLDLYGVLNDSDPELEGLRAAVQAGSPPPPLAEGAAAATEAQPFGDLPAPPLADLTRIGPPGGDRSLSGALDRSPFNQPSADFPAGPLDALFGRSESAPEPEPAQGSEVATEAEIAAETLAPEPALPEPVLPEPVLPEPVLPEPVTPEPGPRAASLEDEASRSLPQTADDEEEASPVASEADPGAGATATLGALYLAQGHLDEAERTFRQVLQRDPSDLDALSGLDDVKEARREAASGPGAAQGGGAALKIEALRGYLDKIRLAAGRSR